MVSLADDAMRRSARSPWGADRSMRHSQQVLRLPSPPHSPARRNHQPQLMIGSQVSVSAGHSQWGCSEESGHCLCGGRHGFDMIRMSVVHTHHIVHKWNSHYCPPRSTHTLLPLPHCRVVSARHCPLGVVASSHNDACLLKPRLLFMSCQRHHAARRGNDSRCHICFAALL